MVFNHLRTEKGHTLSLSVSRYLLVGRQERRERETDGDRGRQRETERDRRRQKETEGDRRRQREVAEDRGRQRETEGD